MTGSPSPRSSGAGKSADTAEAGQGLRLRTKAVQLADYLRHCLAEGRLSDPLPGMRLWSKQLGVSRRTLQATVKELQQEGLFTVKRRGVRLAHTTAPAGASTPAAPPRVQVLLDAAYRHHINNYLETLSTLQERLLLHGVELKWEICRPSRLREIARQPATPQVLLVLASLPPVYQRLFAESGQPAIVLGEVAAGLDLPFINANQSAAVRHAAFKLLQRGFTQLTLVHVNADAAGIKSALAAFQEACAGWPRQPVTARLIPTALDQTSLQQTARRLARGVKDRQGFVVLAPVPIGLVVTALLQHGIAVPAQADVVSLFHTREAVTLYPPPTCYPYPTGALVKQLTEAALHYFETQSLPVLKKTVAIEVGK